jgi:8-oxo-dGTP pyrophosphatase MutT (NUDIX family)
MSDWGAEYFEPDAFAMRARELLFGAPEQTHHEADKNARPAAILIPILARSNGATVLLTQRAEGLQDHSGQIAFPGGKIEKSDNGPLHTAMREAFEEVGLPRQAIQPLGFMPPYFSVTGFKITPLVALVEPDMPLTINQGEVSEVFEVPLHFLMNPRNHAVENLEINGIKRKSYAITFEHRYIWGVTAAIIRQLYERLYG